MGVSHPVLDLRILPKHKGRDTYSMRGHCTNCAWKGELLIPLGELAPGRGGGLRTNYAFCQQCHCSAVVVDG